MKGNGKNYQNTTSTSLEKIYSYLTETVNLDNLKNLPNIDSIPLFYQEVLDAWYTLKRGITPTKIDAN